ncbi:MAG: DUF3794 domain-containing protein [Clostridia bacterium]|nr:DUF3794 domain-containing protein [Clostridia bacterium]
MELIWKEIEAERLINEATVQVEVNGALPSPDRRIPREIPGCTARVIVDDAAAANDEVVIRGHVIAQITAIDENGAPFAYESAAEFTHTIEAAGAAAGTKAKVQPVIQTITAVPSGEGAELSSNIDLNMTLLSDVPFRVTGGVSGISDIETKFVKMQHCRGVLLGEESLRLREEISADEITSVISSTGQVLVRDLAIEQGAATISGTITVSAVTVDKSSHIGQLTRQIPFRERISVNGFRDKAYCKAELGSVYIRSLGEDIGLLAMEAEVTFSVYGTDQAEIVIPVDAFSPSVSFDCVKDDIRLLSTLGPVSAQTTLKETIDIPAGAADLAAPLFTEVRPLITDMEIRKDVLCISGLLATTIAYESVSGRSYTFMEEIPFTSELDISDGCSRATASAYCIGSVISSGERSVQIQYNLLINAEQYREDVCSAVVGLAEAEPAEKRHGLIVCFASEGETAFEIAKRYRMPSADIRKLNPDAAEPYKEGEGLIVLV